MKPHDYELSLLRGRRDLARLAAFPFNFDLDRDEHVEAVRLASGAALEAVAGDDTGGTFFVCEDGVVLYATSEGEAGVIGGSVDEALEMLIGLPGWPSYTSLDPRADDAALAAVIVKTEEDIRTSYGPTLDVERRALLTALGLRQLSQTELIRRLQRALLRTDPDHVLLNAEDGRAYALLDQLPRPPLWRTAIAPGQADLASLRTDPTRWPELAVDSAWLAGVLRAAQYDRQPSDLPLLRVLLRHVAGHGATEELRLAAVLVGLHGDAQDHALLRSLGAAEPGVRYALRGLPDAAQDLRGWAAELDASTYGDDPENEHAIAWAKLASRQGRTELARATFLRLLDDAGPRDASLPGLLATELERIGDLTQAARAQKLHASLQDDAGRRGGALIGLASFQRRAGDIDAAWRSLQRAMSALDGPPSHPTDQLTFDLGLPEPARPTLPWRELGLGPRATEEHFRVAHAAATADLSAVARAALAAGTELLREIQQPTEALRRTAEKAKAAVDGGTSVPPADSH